MQTQSSYSTFNNEFIWLTKGVYMGSNVCPCACVCVCKLTIKSTHTINVQMLILQKLNQTRKSSRKIQIHYYA